MKNLIQTKLICKYLNLMIIPLTNVIPFAYNKVKC